MRFVIRFISALCYRSESVLGCEADSVIHIGFTVYSASIHRTKQLISINGKTLVPFECLDSDCIELLLEWDHITTFDLEFIDG